MPRRIAVEGFYDRNGASAGSRWSDRHGLRRQAWWSVFSGGLGGYACGAEPIWLHGHGSNTPTAALTWDSGKDAARTGNSARRPPSRWAPNHCRMHRRRQQRSPSPAGV